ncbi:unnamed protein product [Lactuca virosa]|uniref:Uncharacterized protein n=1 Tax=Lactuca virosa TaxID=75947 RepID=A0AAU9NEY9_9ASTR|nr:unnamed protein product [Lactuca virosa]
MSDKGLARNLFSVGPPSGGRPSSLPDPNGLPHIPLTGGSIQGARSSPLSDPSGLPRNALTGGFILGARSSPLPDPSCLPHNIFTGSFVSGGRSSPNLSGLQHNPFLGGSASRSRSSPGLNGLPRIPLAGGLSRTSVRTTRPIFSGSSSMGAINTHMGLTDAIADTGVYCMFGTQKIHRAILKIFWQSVNEPWITYRKIPLGVVTQIFERFRTQYRWDPNEEGRILEGFENTLKDRYRDRMQDARKASTNSARKVGHVIAKISDDFEILANYNLDEIHRDVWRRLCRKELTGEDPSFIDLYYKTHLTAESKKIYFGGDKEAPVDFVNETSRVAIESYNKALSQKYGEDPTQHNVNDPELWTQTQLIRKGGKQKGSYLWGRILRSSLSDDGCIFF